MDRCYIPRNSWDNPIKSKKELCFVLKLWLFESRNCNVNEIGDLNLYTSNTAIIHVIIDGVKYYMNRDTKRDSVERAVSIIDGEWRVVANNRGRLNKVILGNEPIKGLYLYKKLD